MTVAVEPDAAPSVLETLALASVGRALSLCLAPPIPDLRAHVKELALAAGGDWGDRLQGLAALVPPDACYQRAFVPTGPCGTGESDHARNPFGAKGGLLGDVAAFYRAFGFHPESELRESPDHVAAELSFVAYLHLKEAYALHDGDQSRAEVCQKAREKFADEHLRPFLERLRLALSTQAAPLHTASAELAMSFASKGRPPGERRPEGYLRRNTRMRPFG